MNQFIQKHQTDTIGTLSGFDRLVLRGTLRTLAYAGGMMGFLSHRGVLLKDFGSYVEQTTERLRKASCAAAQRLGRPVRYLPSAQTRKEDVARQMAAADRIEEGLIGVLTCVEPCMSFEVRRDPTQKRLVLESRRRKCLHLYHYWIDRDFGFMHARVQTWFPFTIQVCLNGREWLARQMDRRGIGYQRRENCFARLDDVAAAQRLFDRMLRLAWPEVLRKIAAHANPALPEILAGLSLSYYWSVHQSEWATDVMFQSRQALAAVYPSLVRGSMLAFSSEDVMRFLGKAPRANFQGEVVSDYKDRPEGVRVKHQVNHNSVKVYDKQGSVLRVETTINDPSDFRVFRPKQNDPEGPCQWQPMRKGIADLHRRAEVSQACNDRYLEALASLNADQPLRELVAPACRPIRWHNRPVRALRPWSAEDRSLIEAVSRGEFAVNGLRNRDLVARLHPAATTPEERRRAASRVTRSLRMLRAHGILRKIPRTHRYLLTDRGRAMATAILAYQHLTMEQLNQLAA
jgi:hypothetical protein